jgi:uncharacterized repeat protein (TIGR02543 family)
MSLRALPLAARLGRVAPFILISLLLGTSLLASANAHAAKLTVAKRGSGTITSSPAGINCGTTCSASYARGTSVTLTASAATGYSFAGWSGACSGTSASCTVSVTGTRRVTATFTPNVVNYYTLTVSKSGAGSVTSSPAGINCGTACSASYASGTSVTLTVTPASGYSFSGWGGACSGTSVTCTVSITAARSVTATFSPNVASYQCSGSGLAATDLSGQCRASPPTMGALEAIDAGSLLLRVIFGVVQ